MKSRFKQLFNTVRNTVRSAVGKVVDVLSGTGLSVKESRSGVSVDDFSREVAEEIAKDFKKELKKEKEKITNARKKLVNEMKPMVLRANLQLNQLKKQGLETVSAYRQWERNGKIIFSVRGETYQELQREYWRVKRFLEASTSTVDGAIKNMKRIGTDLMGLSSNYVNTLNTEQLVKATTDFFKIAEQVKENLEAAGKGAMAMDYQAIFNAIAEYISSDTVDITSISVEQLENAAKQISDMLQQEKAYEEEIMKW